MILKSTLLFISFIQLILLHKHNFWLDKVRAGAYRWLSGGVMPTSYTVHVTISVLLMISIRNLKNNC